MCPKLNVPNWYKFMPGECLIGVKSESLIATATEYHTKVGGKDAKYTFATLW